MPYYDFAHRPVPRHELLVTVLLAIATVATAWSSYQSARWSGVQTINFSTANAARAPLTPFVMPQYHLAARDHSAALDRRAAASTATAKADNQRLDNYALAVVLFASSLFFAGISTKLERPRYRDVIVAVGYVLFIGTLIWLATFPVTVSV